MLNHTGRILAPKWIAFFSIVRHRPYFTTVAINIGLHGIPDKPAATGKGKVTYVFRIKYPRFLAYLIAGFGFESCLCFLLRYNDDWFLRCSCLRQTLLL